MLLSPNVIAKALRLRPAPRGPIPEPPLLLRPAKVSTPRAPDALDRFLERMKAREKGYEDMRVQELMAGP